MRWTWIDRFVRFESGKSAVAVKSLSLAEDHFADHFPGFPVMPAPLILEGLAQTGGILVGEASNYANNVVLAKMTNVKIRREALAGEQLTYTTTIVALNETGAQVQATARSGNELVLEAEIMFAHVPAAQLPPGLPSTQFVFDGGLKNLLRTAEVIKPPAPESEPPATPKPAPPASAPVEVSPVAAPEPTAAPVEITQAAAPEPPAVAQETAVPAVAEVSVTETLAIDDPVTPPEPVVEPPQPAADVPASKGVAKATIPEIMPPLFVTEALTGTETLPGEPPAVSDTPAESQSVDETNNRPVGGAEPPAGEPNSP